MWPTSFIYRWKEQEHFYEILILTWQMANLSTVLTHTSWWYFYKGDITTGDPQNVCNAPDVTHCMQQQRRTDLHVTRALAVITSGYTICFTSLLLVDVRTFYIFFTCSAIPAAYDSSNRFSQWISMSIMLLMHCVCRPLYHFSKCARRREREYH